MAEFVQEYAAVRWTVVVAFLVASVIVVARFATVRPAVASGPDPAVAHRESDAAHLVMCLVMLAMLVFPTGASPHALRGVLVAMTVVFAASVVHRLAQWRAGVPEAAAGAFAIGYHAVAAGAMLFAMGGHGASGHTGPPMLPALALAALFAADALAVLLARGGHRLPHPIGGSRVASIPHVVMDLGAAYMLIAAVAG
ncbi:DUF5134 domain-containing protein [Nocardia puris]|uniref:Uncharacterized protein DUF5134 n=1 Tax=Nocardia puris TaxID=208602 RepID=A0A366E275_9NOCA|nr:DUF5134 domain-containing protein [Nocardia puris]MBF6212709.1 DUF5134 domain-containing protein [Nocardia puris]MBF6367647.1 DUF5134 domain-containing protein [Nocardia puris]MBF6461298.1 DUF5134 domain-containing protein [Nocardia puris]RBO96470.1 uncharacterized protein DUF5134 [Nocardia puris]